MINAQALSQILLTTVVNNYITVDENLEQFKGKSVRETAMSSSEGISLQLIKV